MTAGIDLKTRCHPKQLLCGSCLSILKKAQEFDTKAVISQNVISKY
jgi:hypothetical protein